jgi:Zn-dependent oligopeptidase
MFETKFNKEGLLNPKTGLDYRKKILEPGGSIVIAFLYSIIN